MTIESTSEISSASHSEAASDGPLEAVPFDPHKAIQELVEGWPPPSGPRLTFADKCAAYCALKMGIKPIVLEQAYGMTRPTISHLKNASSQGLNFHYRNVAREFERLGDTAFREKYYTDDVHTRLMRVKYDVAQPADKAARAPNPRADKYAFVNNGAFDTKIGPMRIDWKKLRCEYPELREGWWFIACQADGERGDTKINRYRGQESDLSGQAARDMDPDYRKPYLTSGAAFHGALIFSGDRIKPA